METQTTERYCPICGKPVKEETYNRFGDRCCSEAHAEEYVVEVRAQKQRQVVGASPAQAERRKERHGGCCR